MKKQNNNLAYVVAGIVVLVVLVLGLVPSMTGEVTANTGKENFLKRFIDKIRPNPQEKTQIRNTLGQKAFEDLTNLDFSEFANLGMGFNGLEEDISGAFEGIDIEGSISVIGSGDSDSSVIVAGESSDDEDWDKDGTPDNEDDDDDNDGIPDDEDDDPYGENGDDSDEIVHYLVDFENIFFKSLDNEKVTYIYSMHGGKLYRSAYIHPELIH